MPEEPGQALLEDRLQVGAGEVQLVHLRAQQADPAGPSRAAASADWPLQGTCQALTPSLSAAVDELGVRAGLAEHERTRAHPADRPPHSRPLTAMRRFPACRTRCSIAPACTWTI
ncbi:hypothetical protein IU422_07035 [Nocardia farcinica]|nr:hypothetical protein [Nocardia farcinica]